MTESAFRLNRVITEYDCTATGQLHLGQLLGILMTASLAQEASLFSEQELAQRTTTWVVLQNDLTILHLPSPGDKVIIETEPLAYNKFFSTRVSSSKRWACHCASYERYG